MADIGDPHLVIEALRILTRPDEGGLLLRKDTNKSRFDLLLNSNADTLREKLETEPGFTTLQSQWRSDTTISVPSHCSSRWDFVLFCLKTLHLLQKSLKSSVEEYKKQEPESVRPSGAPQISPDTLSFEEQKVVLTAVQFVVCLGISPCLDKGVGIPIEARSEFSKLIHASGDTGEVDSKERQLRLFICLKVFISCIFTPSLGSVILSRHLADILAGLLQLTHSVNKETPKPTKEAIEKLTDKENTIQTENIESSNSEASGDVDCKVPKVDKELPAADQFTPASIVDHVRKSFQFESDEASSSQKCSEGDNSAALNHAKSETENDKEETKETSKANEIGVNEVGEFTHEEVDVEYCETVLEDLMEKIYPPLLVKTLLLLQGGPRPKKQAAGKFSLPPAPAWLRKVCGKQLTVIMMRPKGVQSILRGMLDAPGEEQGMSQASDWRKCDAVAKLIACCPLQSRSVESYYKTIGPQILEILHIPDKQVARQFLRVACSTITSMAAQYADLTRQYIILPLIEPLVRCTENNETLSGMESSKVIAEEGLLCSCVEDCHRVFVSGTTASPQLIQCLQPVILTMFQLLLFTKQGVSGLKTACHELITSYLKQTELTVTLTCLELMAFQITTRSDQGFVRMHPNVVFCHGSSGGVVAIYDPDREMNQVSQDIHVQCMVDLLKDLQNDGTAGEFLIYMLQELTTILRTEVAGENPVSSPGKPDCADSEVLMNIESEYQSQEVQFYRKLLLLNLLATVCESLGPSCIKSTKNTLAFVRATLERAVEVCKATADPVFEVFESETLTMAMGLLTAVLTGAMQVTDDDRKTMEELLPLLQDICDNHPESSIQEMTSDLRIAIATHGAVWTELTKSSTGDFKDLKTKIQQNTSKPKQAVKKPVIEVITDSKSDNTKDNVQTHKNKRQDVSIVEQDNTDMKKIEPDQKANAHVGSKSNPNGKKNSHIGSESGANKDKPIPNSVDSITIIETDYSALNKSEANRTETNKVQSEESTAGKTKSSEKDELSSPKASHSELEEAFKELCDPLLPVRGHGLIRLTRMVQRRDKEAFERKETILKIFEENLDHPDSYMYLSSVNGLAAMADVFPDFVIPRVCEKFTNSGKEGKKRSPELRMKLGEIMVKASRSLGDTIPKYRDLLLNTVLTGARDSDSLVRASSVSNLGEICKLLHFSLGNIVHEVFDCCKSLLKSDPDPEVRKAAAMALTLLLQGLGQDIIKVLDSVLLDLYRLLKLIMTTEKDETVRLNANLALNELEDTMKDYVFPQQKLEKRIRVLDME